MIQFHESGYGHKFFDVQFPKLISEIGRVADALSKKEENHAKSNGIARFSKVSYSRYLKDLGYDYGDSSHEEQLAQISISKRYTDIRLPKRATTGSAGYDFFSPISFSLKPGETIKIPTGIRCEMENGWVLTLVPRSSLGFKYRLQLNNTVGIIDSDYYFSDNEGHIFIKLTNDSNENKTVEVKAGEGFAQGIFLPFGCTYDDNVSAKRNGGFGSTTK